MQRARNDRRTLAIRAAQAVRAVACCLIAALTTVACTGPTPGLPSVPQPTGPASTGPARTVTASPVTTTSAPNPYSLASPKPRKSVVASVWHTPGQQTGRSGQIAADTGYLLRGSCIYGVGDTIDYQLVDADSLTPTGVLGSGSIDCDGGVHTKKFRSPARHLIDLEFGDAGDKTKAYLELDRH